MPFQPAVSGFRLKAHKWLLLNIYSEE